MMKNFRILPLLLILFVLIVTGCAQQETEEPTTSPVSRVSTLEELIAGLEASGAEVAQGEEQQDSFFPVNGRIITVNGMSITVWEFADEAAREAASATISGGGFIIGTAMVDWIDQPNFFAQGRLIVLYVGKDPSMIELLTKLLGTQVNAPPPSGGMTPLDEGAPHTQAARAALAGKLGIVEEDIVLISVNQVEWSDSCLGLPQPDEMCAQAITPGYLVTFEARGASYEVHTNESGSAVRIKE